MWRVQGNPFVPDSCCGIIQISRLIVFYYNLPKTDETPQLFESYPVYILDRRDEDRVVKEDRIL